MRSHWSHNPIQKILGRIKRSGKGRRDQKFLHSAKVAPVLKYIFWRRDHILWRLHAVCRFSQIILISHYQNSAWVLVWNDLFAFKSHTLDYLIAFLCLCFTCIIKLIIRILHYLLLSNLRGNLYFRFFITNIKFCFTFREWHMYNGGRIVFRLFGVLPNFSFATSATGHDYR